MATITKVVIHDAVAHKHGPLPAGDKLSGTIVQVSADAGNSLTTGTDGGLLVAVPVAQLPDDQVLTGDNTGSVAVTLTPTTVGDNTNYLIKADTKIDPAVGNIAIVSSNGIFVPAPVIPTPTDATAPTIVDDGTTTTQYFGGNSVALGNPLKWVSTDGGTTVSPVYTASGISGSTPVVNASKQTAFGEVTQSSNSSSNSMNVTFATAFSSAPFITLTSKIRSAAGAAITVRDGSVTTTGFIIDFYTFGGGSQNIGKIEWKAEEK